MSEFLHQMRRRAARYHRAAPVSVAPDRGVLSLSFDDIPVSAWTEAGPIMAEHGIKATYYVAGGMAGGRNLGLPQFETEHLLQIAEAGHEIGCHTYEHVSVLTLSAAELEASIDRNARWVADRLDGRRMTSFAYPFGDASITAKRVIARRFRFGRGVRDGVNSGTVDGACLLAIGLESRRLPGYDLEALIQATVDRKGWLIAYGHDVSDRPTPYGCRPEDLDGLIRMASAAGLDVLPVEAAWERAAASRGRVQAAAVALA